MKRALFLTYYVPPRAAIASIRAGHIIRSLAAHGWEIVPVVPDFGDVTYEPPVRTTAIVDFKAPMRKLLGVRAGETTHDRFRVNHGSNLQSFSWRQRAIRFGHGLAGYANGRFGWYVPGTQAVAKMLREEHFDAIISTSPPEATHIVASRVAGSIPWIADLRDPWLRSDVFAQLPALRALDRVLEPHVLHKASALVTVSEPLAGILRGRYPGKAVYSVPNAFDAREWDGIPFAATDRATFVHAGQLYQGRCDPRPLFEAVAGLLRRGAIDAREIRLDFYGEREPWLEEFVAHYRLHDVVRLHGRRPREEVLRAERTASRLLIVLKTAHGRTGPEERGNYTGKLFEYFGARRRIIALGGPTEDTVVDEALARSGAGRRYRDAASLADAVLAAVAEWRSGRTAVLAPENVAPFELQHFGERFAEIFERCVQRSPSQGAAP